MSDSRGKDSSFLRKVVKFVSNPNTEWGDIDPPLNTPAPGAPDRSELQVMIERKRRNDFVRKQELDLLRQIRREGLTGDQVREMQREQGFENSGYQPTEQGALPPSEVRRRIDGIEREMSFEDTEVNTRSLPVPQRNPANSGRLSTVAMQATTPLGLGAGVTVPGSHRQLGAQVTLPKVDLHFDPMSNPAGLHATQASSRSLGSSASSDYQRTPDPTPAAAAGEAARWHPMLELEGGDEELAHDPELDSAAIAFANADFGGCEKIMRALVGPGGSRERHVPTWRALLDLYRAIGQQQRFEWASSVAVKDLGQPAPNWVSIPRLAMNMEGRSVSDVEQGHAAPAGTAGAVAWPCPARLDAAAINAMRSHVRHSRGPALMDWTPLQMLDREGAAALRTLMREWAATPTPLQWEGVDALFDLLEIAAPPGDHLADPAFWQVRLETLRLLGVSGAYDVAAEDFAATYGTTPPDWSPAATKVAAADGSLQGLGSVPEFAVSTLPDELGLTSTVTVELVGQLGGDVSAILATTLSDIGDANTVMVSCARLIRVDLMAAGELLNWVAARRSEGRLVRFTQVHRMVALFFCAMGLNDQAPIELRPL